MLPVQRQQFNIGESSSFSPPPVRLSPLYSRSTTKLTHPFILSAYTATLKHTPVRPRSSTCTLPFSCQSLLLFSTLTHISFGLFWVSILIASSVLMLLKIYHLMLRTVVSFLPLSGAFTIFLTCHVSRASVP